MDPAALFEERDQEAIRRNRRRNGISADHLRQGSRFRKQPRRIRSGLHRRFPPRQSIRPGHSTDHTTRGIQVRCPFFDRGTNPRFSIRASRGIRKTGQAPFWPPSEMAAPAVGFFKLPGKRAADLTAMRPLGRWGRGSDLRNQLILERCWLKRSWRWWSSWPTNALNSPML